MRQCAVCIRNWTGVKKVKSRVGPDMLLSSYSKFSLCYAFKLVQMEVKCLLIKKFMWYIFCPNHPVEKPDFSSCYIFSNKILPEYHEHIAYCMAFRWQMKDTLDGAYESTSFWQVFFCAPSFSRVFRSSQVISSFWFL